MKNSPLGLVKELILAVNYTVESDVTAHVISDIALKNLLKLPDSHKVFLWEESLNILIKELFLKLLRKELFINFLN